MNSRRGGPVCPPECIHNTCVSCMLSGGHMGPPLRWMNSFPSLITKKATPIPLRQLSFFAYKPCASLHATGNAQRSANGGEDSNKCLNNKFPSVAFCVAHNHVFFKFNVLFLLSLIFKGLYNPPLFSEASFSVVPFV